MRAQTKMTLALMVILALSRVPPVSTANARPKGRPERYTAIPLGQIRVTHYTHHECGSRITASGYTLKDSDEGRVCAVSRDWWRTVVKPGDLVWIEGHARPCVALDTMALKNRKGFPQRRWVDIYHTDRQKALDFGIQRATAYLLKPTL
jgi:3D (Asp-Asp-Asp) domain-containing protein